MSAIKTGWLNDKNGDKFAPKTLTTQIQTTDGILLEDKIQSDIDVAMESIQANVEDLKELVGDEAVAAQISNAVSQKSQVQIITWGADD